MSVTEQPAAPSGPAPQIPQRADTSSGPSTPLGTALFGLGVLGLLAVLAAMIGLAFFAILNDDGGSGDAAISTDLDISLSEFAIDGDLSAPAGEVTLNIVNGGAIEHNLAVRELGVQSSNMMSRGVDTLALGELEPGAYQLYCSIAGHEQSGMSAELVVTEGGDDSAAAEGGGDMGHGGDHGQMTPEEMDRLMVETMLAFPAETEGSGNQLLEPEILADGTKKFTLTAEIIPWEVAPGEIVEAWAYNGQVPGPQIKLDVGDNVQVELTNLTPMSTDIHFHGIHTPNDQDGVSPYTQDPIRTGETFTYEFEAVDPAIGMYHAHMHGQTSVINGMFAAFMIGDNPLPYGETISGVTIPDDVEPAFEMPMVLNDAGTIGLTLNGK